MKHERIEERHAEPYTGVEPHTGGEPYTGIERRVRKPVLGLRLRDFDVAQSATYMLATRRSAEEGAGLFVTPNVQHIALARTDPVFAAAIASATIVVADGFPVYRFAKARGLGLPGRITGREVVERMFADPAALAGHRAYFVVDSEETARLIDTDIIAATPDFAGRTHVPAFGFDADPAQCAALADDIRAFGTTLLFLCIGAPKSEVFAHRHRVLLPPCWVLCVGQSFRLVLGTTAAPPALMVRLNLEWLWRIVLEPRRMLRRYVPSSWGFARAALADLRRKP